jgi:hypothetical protein
VHRSFAESDERTRTIALEGGQERIQAAHALQIRGPLSVTGIGSSPSRDKIFVCKPTESSEERRCATEIVTQLAERAFRRPITDDDLGSLMAFYDSGARDGFEGGVRDAVSAVLASPHFIYRAESGEAGAGRRAISSSLRGSRSSSGAACRIRSCSSLPKPSASAIRASSRSRYTACSPTSARSRSSMTSVPVAQRREARPDRARPRPVPHASGLLDMRDLMEAGAQLFVDSVLRSDRSVVELLTADYSFLNERLAMHYGIETVKGARFREVKLPDESRYGLLGKGAILMLTAYPNRTSPVLRGAWIQERILGSPPPSPPPDVRTSQTTNAASRRGRCAARLEQHRENPTCCSCHGVMDPLGFALENFNAVGQYRSIDPDTRGPIDASGTLPDGTPVANAGDLRRALAKHPEKFVQALTENLLTFALGRTLDYRDMPVVREIVRRAEKDDYRFESLVLGVVQSDAFREREASNLMQASVASSQ